MQIRHLLLIASSFIILLPACSMKKTSVKKNTVHSIYKSIQDNSIMQSSKSDTVFDWVVSLLVETNNLLQIMLSDTKLLLKDRIDGYAALEVSFDIISKQLAYHAKDNNNVTELALIASNFSSISQRLIEFLILVSDGEGIKSSAIASQCRAEFFRDSARFVSIIQELVMDQSMNSLNQEVKERLKSKLMDSFKEDINKFRAALNKFGTERAAQGTDGLGWPAVILYMALIDWVTTDL